MARVLLRLTAAALVATAVAAVVSAHAERSHWEGVIDRETAAGREADAALARMWAREAMDRRFASGPAAEGLAPTRLDGDVPSTPP